MSSSDSEEDKIINCVALNPVIYDQSHENFRNWYVKETAWKSIAEQVNISAEDCKRKWKLIRDGYQRFKKNNKWGGVASKNAKVKRHQQLAFLDGAPLPTRADLTADAADAADADDAAADAPHNSDSTQHTIKTEHTPPHEETDEQPVPEPLQIQHKRNVPQQKHRRKRIVKRANNYDKLLKYRKKRDDKKEDLPTTTNKKKDDDIDLFCRHIEEVLRNLPPLYKAEAKKHIGVMISNYEIKAAQLHAGIEFTTPSMAATYQFTSSAESE